MARIKFEVENFDFWIKKLQEKNKNIKEVSNKALIESKKIVTDKLLKDTVDSNMPAGGKYASESHPVRSSINRDNNTEWHGNYGEIKVGYDFNISGLVSIFLMYGTPRMDPAKKIYSDIYGNATRNEIYDKQMDIILDYFIG